SARPGWSAGTGSAAATVVRFPCGSVSTRRTRRPARVAARASWNAVVDLPTPPFWLHTARTRAPVSGTVTSVEGLGLAHTHSHGRGVVVHLRGFVGSAGVVTLPVLVTQRRAGTGILAP